MKTFDYMYEYLSRKRSERKKQKEYMQFESTSIGDMAFLLLIFFIVTGSFVIRQGIFFSLPSKDAGAIKVEESRIMDVYPDEAGFYYQDKLLSREAFKAVMAEKRKESEENVMVIIMEDGVRYERLVDALSVAKETGIARVSLRNQSEDK